jgi:hypothetical protein
VAALRDRFGAAKPDVHAPQSGWHGFDKTEAVMAESLDLFAAASVVSACPPASAETS